MGKLLTAPYLSSETQQTEEIPPAQEIPPTQLSPNLGGWACAVREAIPQNHRGVQGLQGFTSTFWFSCRYAPQI